MSNFREETKSVGLIQSVSAGLLHSEPVEGEFRGASVGCGDEGTASCRGNERWASLSVLNAEYEMDELLISKPFLKHITHLKNKVHHLPLRRREKRRRQIP